MTTARPGAWRRSVLAGAAALGTALALAACSEGGGQPAPGNAVVPVADVRTQVEPAAGTTVTRTVVRTEKVTAAPRTVLVTRAPETVTAAPRTVTAAPRTVVSTRTATVTQRATVTQTVTVTAVSTAEAQGLVGGGDSSVYYANCSEARAAGAAPVRIGDPGYRPSLDRDGDGVGCE